MVSREYPAESLGEMEMDSSKEIFLRTFVKALHRHISFGQIPSLKPLFVKRRGAALEVREEGGYLPIDDVSQMQRIRQLQGTHLETIKKFGEIVESRDRFTDGHTDRMANLSRRLSQELGWRAERQEVLEIGTYLHDVGKIAIPEEILNKSGELTKREFKHVQRHPQIGASLLKSVDFLQPVVPFVLYHQERYEGTGYPYGLAGKRIPLEGRVMAVLDTYDSLTRQRPYRPPLRQEEALTELRNQSGRQLDPEIVEAFLSILPDTP
jgi:HD-GYP domain-containing protein (c-di-GMP phosphodiesterase class II)